jgi:hypothetical protein
MELLENIGSHFVDSLVPEELSLAIERRQEERKELRGTPREMRKELVIPETKHRE